MLSAEVRRAEADFLNRFYGVGDVVGIGRLPEHGDAPVNLPTGEVAGLSVDPDVSAVTAIGIFPAARVDSGQGCQQVLPAAVDAGSSTDSIGGERRVLFGRFGLHERRIAGDGYSFRGGADFQRAIHGDRLHSQSDAGAGQGFEGVLGKGDAVLTRSEEHTS